MCGIAGIISPFPNFITRERLQPMADILRHRGPDGEGLWQNENVGFAHRRLRIIDTSTAGDQPLHYLHYTLVFNGEIYNYRELKKELQAKGYQFATQTDTEVIPAAYDCWKDGFLHKLDGMFAFALYDHKAEQVLLARDRFGQKPLYYFADYRERGRFVQFLFGSEMKALWAVGVPKNINGEMMLHFLTLGNVQNPYKKTATFFNQILSLPPGHLLSVQPKLGRVQMRCWYRLTPKLDTQITEENALARFKELLDNAVQKCLRSDVPIGTSLSGGVDSSAIAAIIQQLKEHEPYSQQCFSAVFPGFKNDESARSREIVDYLGLKQLTISPSAADLADEFAALSYHQEEPVQSSSVFVQYKIYQLAAQHGVTVLLEGQGADEVLGGYMKYTQWFLQYLLRHRFGTFRKEKRLFLQNRLLPEWGLKNVVAAFFPEKTAQLLQCKAVRYEVEYPHLNKEFLSQFHHEDALRKPVVKVPEDLMYFNVTKMGLEEYLRYADRNSMAFSRELRLPFLQHDLVEFLFSLPSSFKFHNGFTKMLLRQSMQKLLPPDIVWQKGKIGYEPPQKEWMGLPAVRENIMEARKKLVDLKIFTPELLTTPLSQTNAHDRDNLDWKIWSAAQLVK